MIECINCSRLGQCKETDAQKLLGHYRCDRWEATSQEETQARIDAITRFGIGAAQALVTMNEEEE